MVCDATALAVIDVRRMPAGGGLALTQVKGNENARRTERPLVSAVISALISGPD